MKDDLKKGDFDWKIKVFFGSLQSQLAGRVELWTMCQTFSIYFFYLSGDNKQQNLADTQEHMHKFDGFVYDWPQNKRAIEQKMWRKLHVTSYVM